MLNDLRLAFRKLRRTPVFTLTCLVTLALGIGATTALFSVIRGVLLAPLPFPESDNIMVVWEANPERGFPRFSFSGPNYLDLAEQSRSFTALAAQDQGEVIYTGGEEAQRLQASEVTHQYLQVMGLSPLLGRDLVAADDQAGAPRVAIVSESLWKGQFGADPDLVGRSLTLNGEPHTVVGIFPNSVLQEEVFINPTRDLTESRGAHYFSVRGRLAPGATVEQAQAEVAGILEGLAVAYPETNDGWTGGLAPLKEMVVGNVRGSLWLLFGAVFLVLLIACGNVANLLLTRLAHREREVAVRSALGAGRRRILRLLLAESVVLSLLGGLLGAALAWVAVRVLSSAASEAIPRVEQITLSPQVLLFAVLLSLLTSLIFGLLPAWRASRPNLATTIKEGGRGETSGKGWLRGGLVLAEVALAVLLLAGAGLLFRSLTTLMAVNPGFDPAQVASYQITLPEASYQDAAARSRLFEQLVDATAALPGADSAAFVSPLPFTGLRFMLLFAIEGRPLPETQQQMPVAHIQSATPGYFETLRIALRSGRTFQPSDTLDAPQVAVLNQTAARQYFPDEDPLGQRISFDGPAPDAEWLEIVGVVDDTLSGDLSEEVAALVYWNALQRPVPFGGLVVRSEGIEANTFFGPSRELLANLDPNLPMYDLATMERRLADNAAQPRFNASLLGLFAALALILAAVGVYGVLSYTVSQRVQEIGVRMALGAGRGQILKQVIKQGMVPVGLGIAFGTLLALLSGKAVESLLFNVSAQDPLSLILAPAALALVALLACWLPALRAAAIAPTEALRHE
ncbi:MAG: ABC transporter permease [Acidobacteriota bacterium]